MVADPGSLPALRQRNRHQILEVVRHRGTTSRPDIAKRTGLSPTTVSTLVGQLLAEAVVVELPDTAVPAGGGRPARLLGVNPPPGGVVGVPRAPPPGAALPSPWRGAALYAVVQGYIKL